MPVNRVITFVLLLTGFNSVFCQIDAVTMKNGDVLIGEVKSLNKGVLVLETDYSDSDFKIDYDEVQGLNLTNTFVIDLTSGKHLVGSIASLSDGNFLIQTKAGERVQVSPKKIVNINLKSDNEITEIVIEDDGNGYPKDILSKIGEPYLKSNDTTEKSKAGLGLGLFIGKTLLEKNFASVNCRNSKTRKGAEVIIRWKNKDLFNI